MGVSATRNRIFGVLCIAIMLCVSLLTSFNSLVRADGAEDGSDITSLTQLGVIRASTVTLGPGQVKLVDLSSKVSGRFSATAASRDNRTATVSRPAENREQRAHITADITAGENETDKVKTTVIVFTITREGISAAIPGRKPGARVNRPPSGDSVRTMTITVNVLPKKRFVALQEEHARQVAADREAALERARTSARSGNRPVNLCVRERRFYNMDSEVLSSSERNKPLGNPVPLTGLRITRHTNPGAVGTLVLAKYGADGKQTSDAIRLAFGGRSVGMATITVEESPPPMGPSGVAVLPWRQVFDVTVRECTEKEKPRTAVLPEGYTKYKPLVSSVPTDDLEDFGDKKVEKPDDSEREAYDDDEEFLKELDRIGKSDASDKAKTDKKLTDKKTADSTPKQMNMMSDGGLAIFQAAVPSDKGDKQLTVNCPQDAAAGDVITCSVMTDSTDSAMQLEIESTQVFFDTPHTPGPQTFTATMPKGAKEAPIVLKGKDGKILFQSMLALMPEQPMDDKAKIYFPRQAHADGPMQFKGAFPEDIQETLVQVNGQDAPILAKSPRSLVAQNPTGVAGPHDVVVKEGAFVQRGVVQSVPNNVALNSTNPAIAMPTTPTQKAIDGACQELVSLYKQNLRGEIDRNWHPPKPFTKGTWITLLKYDLTKDNRVVNINVVKPSGDARLDQSAVSRVYQLQGQFKPIPECYQQDRLQIDHTFKIIYR